MTIFARWARALVVPFALFATTQLPARAVADILYSADSLDNIVYRLDTTTGMSSVLSSNPGAVNFPTGLAVTADGSTLYLANRGANDIVKFNTATGAYSIFADTGLVAPEAIVLSPDGKTLYVANSYAGDVLSYNTTTGIGSILASGLSYPTGLALSPDGSTLYLGEFDGNKIDRINTATHQLSTLASLSYPGGLAVTSDGSSLYATIDSNPGSIYKYDIATGTPTLITSTGLTEPLGLALSADNSTLYVADTQSSQILSYNTSTWQDTVVANQTYPGYLALSSAVQSVPEPASLIMLATAMAGVAGCRFGYRTPAAERGARVPKRP